MKKIVLISILAGLIIILLGWWAVASYYAKKNEGVLSASEIEEFRSRKAFFSDFTKREEGGDVWMDSDKAKVSVKIPKDWIVYEGSFSAFSIVSKDFVPLHANDNTPFPSKGCGIDFNVKIDKKVNGYKNFTQETLDNPDYFVGNYYDVSKVMIGDLYGMKQVVEPKTTVTSGKVIFMKIPKDNYTYEIDTYLFGEDKERCEKEFDLFLNSLVLK
jgi:hypothetical protein